MMQSWFECKVQYVKIDEDGRERKATENYLLDAVSFTDAEARIVRVMQSLVNGGEFVVTDIKKSRLGEVFQFEDGEWWYKATVNLVTIDEEQGKEKKVRIYYLVEADDIQEALKRLDESLSDMVVPYIVSAITVSTIVDVYPHNAPEFQIPANLKPMSELEEKSAQEAE